MNSLGWSDMSCERRRFASVCESATFPPPAPPPPPPFRLPHGVLWAILTLLLVMAPFVACAVKGEALMQRLDLLLVWCHMRTERRRRRRDADGGAPSLSLEMQASALFREFEARSGQRDPDARRDDARRDDETDRVAARRAEAWAEGEAGVPLEEEHVTVAAAAAGGWSEWRGAVVSGWRGWSRRWRRPTPLAGSAAQSDAREWQQPEPMQPEPQQQSAPQQPIESVEAAAEAAAFEIGVAAGGPTAAHDLLPAAEAASLAVHSEGGGDLQESTAAPEPAVPEPAVPETAALENETAAPVDPSADLGMDGMCVVCLDRSATITLIHGLTGHTCVCHRCAEQLVRSHARDVDALLENHAAKCPVCRLPIEQIVRIFT